MLKLQQIKIDVHSLLLDPENPRLVGFTGISGENLSTATYSPKAQELLRRQLMQREGGNHLMDSMIRLGFVAADALVVRYADNEQYIVIEGNRRLAAIKTILNDIDRKVIKLPKEIWKTLNPLEVRLLESDTSLLLDSALIQGIRHISGVKSWGPYQQGHLINDLVRLKGLNVTEAAKAIGLSISRASILLKAYYGLKQILEHPTYATMASPSLFSHFEYAYIKHPVREWLGWNDDKKQYENESSFSYFCQRITEPQDSKLSISSREVRDYLPIILSNDESRKLFLYGESILESLNVCDEIEIHFTNLIKNASTFIKNISRQKKIISPTQKKQLIQLHHYAEELLSRAD